MDIMDDSVYHQQIAQIAQSDFERARRKAFLNEVSALFRRRSNWLASYDEIQKIFPLREQHYRGMQQVPLSAIVGSVDRYRDFDREFLPTQSHTRPRWESIDIANLTDVSLPPVQLYQVDSLYFVKDGNHRVSVAKEKGAEYIDAEVIECPTPVPIPSVVDHEQLLRLAEYARFLEQTKLDKHRENVCIEFTTLGRYDVLLEHISAHRWYMGINENRPVSWEEAVLDWYDHVYLPVVDIIHERNILKDFPRHTAGDLYLWIMDHRWYLRESTGEEMGPITAVLSYDAQYAKWTSKVARFLGKLQSATMAPLAITAKRVRRALRASRPITLHAEDGREPTQE